VNKAAFSPEGGNSPGTLYMVEKSNPQVSKIDFGNDEEGGVGGEKEVCDIASAISATNFVMLSFSEVHTLCPSPLQHA
jgi:hypothetical protein